MIDGFLCKSTAISRAKLKLISLLKKFLADLDSAPKLCLLNISSRKGAGLNDETLFTRMILDGNIFICWAVQGELKGLGGVRLPMI